MRKGFEGLYGLVRDRLSCEPLSGHLFLFCNGQRNRLNVLVWDGSGLWVCAKRLEKGRFTWPQSGDAQGKVVLSHEELSLLLGGIALTKTKTAQVILASLLAVATITTLRAVLVSNPLIHFPRLEPSRLTRKTAARAP